eukprot:Hpha_TRINITY_DN15445_c0_g5::TRINITY_DN15445_c0_g5_i2::g.175089::m.175089
MVGGVVVAVWPWKQLLVSQQGMYEKKERGGGWGPYYHIPCVVNHPMPTTRGNLAGTWTPELRDSGSPSGSPPIADSPKEGDRNRIGREGRVTRGSRGDGATNSRMKKPSSYVINARRGGGLIHSLGNYRRPYLNPGDPWDEPLK